MRLAAADIDGLEELQRQFGKFRETLSEATGLDVQFFPVSNRTVAGEALRAKQVEFVLTGPSEYVIYQSRVKITPVVAFSRADYSRPSSSGRIAASALGRGTEGQAHGFLGHRYLAHIGPSLLLAWGGLDPAKDIEAAPPVHQVGYTALKRGDVAALGHDAYRLLRVCATTIQGRSGSSIARGQDRLQRCHRRQRMSTRTSSSAAGSLRNPETAAKLKEACW